MKNLWRVLHFFRADWLLVVAAFGLLLLSVTASLLKPWPLALIVDSVLGQKEFPPWLADLMRGLSQAARVGVLGAAVLVVHFGQGALAAGQNYLLIKVGLRGLARVREGLFQWLLRLSLRFHQGTNQGDLIYRATWDTYAFQTLFQHGLFTFITATLSLLLMLTIMARLNGPLTFVALGTLPLLVIAMRYFGREMKSHGVAAHQADGQVASLIQQGIVALPLTQTCTREEAEERRFQAQVATARASRLSQHGWEIVYLGIIALIFGSGTAGIVWVGAWQVQRGLLSVGELLVFIAYLGQLYEPLNQLSHIGVILSDATAGTQRVLEILDTPEEVKDAPDARPVVRAERADAKTLDAGYWIPDEPSIPHPASRIPHPAATPLVLRGSITFERVSFAYQPDHPVLSEVTFTLEAGQAAAIIGPSGAGKTTLLGLLPRFYDPASGAVRLDGADLRALRLKDLRAQIAFVLQEPLLLPGSIAENIAYARPEATCAAIQAAAQAAHADEFIRQLARQYDTLVGEGAARLSVGEKQRLNLARAFLKDAPILALDEPTSALDAESEALVLAGLAELMRGRTTLLVTHRLPALRHVNRVIVLAQGRVLEDGPPDALLQKPDSYFARMAR
jgi:ATP-binding cassette subfamily B protein/subfamily B ATP-binding cassette protein MsbA